MIPGMWKVNCKGCRKPITTGRDDPFQTTDDGSPVYSASCAGCGTTTKYRRPAPVVEAPAYAPPEVPNSALADMVNDEPAFSRAMRLPEIVIQAAWWIRFTLIFGWVVVAAVSSVVIGLFGAGWYAGRHYMTN